MIAAAARRFSFPDIATATRRTFALAVLLILASPALAQFPPEAGETAARFEIAARLITAFDLRDRERREFGNLVFRGGIELTASQRGFGGLSSIRVSADGSRFVIASDRGRWLRGRLNYEETQLTGVSEAEIAPMLGHDGRPLALQKWFDTESLAEDGGIFYVGIERVNRIVRFDYGKDGFNARAEPIEIPADIESLPYNKGLEAMAFVPRGMPLGGTLIAFSERGLDDDGNIKGFLIGGPSPGAIKVARSNDFNITDAAVTPNGDLLILERSFSLLRGVAMRIRRVPLAEIKPGSLIKGEVLLQADRNYNIDNMEGLAVHRAANGDTVLTLLSDNNFNPLQRTILLQFTLKAANGN